MEVSLLWYRLHHLHKIKTDYDLKQALIEIEGDKLQKAQKKAQLIYDNKRIYKNIVRPSYTCLYKLISLLPPETALNILQKEDFTGVILKTKKPEIYLDEICAKHKTLGIKRRCLELKAIATVAHDRYRTDANTHKTLPQNKAAGNVVGNKARPQTKLAEKNREIYPGKMASRHENPNIERGCQGPKTATVAHDKTRADTNTHKTLPQNKAADNTVNDANKLRKNTVKTNFYKGFYEEEEKRKLQHEIRKRYVYQHQRYLTWDPLSHFWKQKLSELEKPSKSVLSVN